MTATDNDKAADSTAVAVSDNARFHQRKYNYSHEQLSALHPTTQHGGHHTS